MHLNWCILHHDGYVLTDYLSLTWIICILVEEADVEDDQGNITKELYVLQAAPLESHAGYRLETEDPAVFSDGGDDDPDSWVCTRVWRHIPIPVRQEEKTCTIHW